MYANAQKNKERERERERKGEREREREREERKEEGRLGEIYKCDISVFIPLLIFVSRLFLAK